MEFGYRFEVESRDEKWCYNSEVLDIDKWEIEVPEMENKKDHQIWKKV